MKILYVEDNPLDVDLTLRQLQRALSEAKLIIAKSLAEAREKLAEESFDVALLDLRLPDGSGLELVAEIRGKEFPMGVVVLTGSGSEGTAVAALKAGADDYLVKSQEYYQMLPAVLQDVYNRLQAHSSRRVQPLQVLYIEHNTIDVDLTRRHMIQNAPHIFIESVPTLEQALTLLPESPDEKIPYDIILMDYRLPGGDALEALRIFRQERGLQIPLVLVTGQGGEQVAVQAMRLGAYDYVIKHRGYLYELPATLENAFHRFLLEQEQKALRASEARFRRLSENAPDIIFRASLEPTVKIEYLSRAVEQITGYTPEELYQDDALVPKVMTDHSGLNELAQLVQDAHAAQKRVTLSLVHRDGHPVWVEVRPVLVYDENGRAVALEGIARDVTAYVMAEQERTRLLQQIQEQAELMRHILNTVPDGVILLNAHKEVVNSNPVAKEYLLVLGVFDENGRLTHLADQPIDTICRQPAPETWQEITTGTRIFEVTARPMVGLQPAGYWVMVLSDVTNERAQQRYQQSQERLATVGQLAAGIAHDFNNILAVITLYTQLLRQTANLPEKHMRQLATIDEQAQHAVNLIGQILDFSHRSVMDFAPIDLLPITKALCKLLERILPDSVHVKVKYEQKAYVIMGDPTRLQQALMNLALNAQDAMPEGGELLFSFSEVNVAEDSVPPLLDMEPGQWIKLSVTDSGTGVQPEHLPRLFEPFFTTKERGKGTGLGLAQVYGIVKQHHGYIDVQSEVGKGTTFTLYLPRLLAEVVSTGDTVALIDSLEGDETILVAEDNAALRQSIREALTELGYTALLAENGRSALTTLSTTTEPIHMIVTDWSMPEIGGAKFIQTLHEQYPNLHILIMSGYPLGISDDVLQLPNVVGWLQKPFSIDALLLKIRQAFDKAS
ncbi:MAG: hypothetical protein Kow0080_29990 [Candidatus Promineifilaceae bacterium]